MAKAAKKSSARKSKTKSASVKASAKTASSSKAKKSVTLDKIYKFNLFAAGANLIFAILSVIFVSKESVNLVLAHATKDELASTSASVLGPAYKIITSVEIRYIMAAIFLISAVFSILFATKLRAKYEAGVSNSTSGLRWLFMGLTLGATLEFASMLAKVEDSMTLKMIGGLIVTTALLSWVAERENKNSKKHYVAFGLSLFTGLLAWLPLLGSLAGTTLYGIESFGWYVYALSALLFAGCISIALANYRHIRDGISANRYLQLEGKYLSTDFLIKFGTFIIILLALYK